MTGFIDALLAARTPVIAELKPRDAAGDDLVRGRSVAEIVHAYRDAGVGCLSVVTGRWFGGTVELLREVAAVSGLPVLQKDFLTTERHLVRAVESGASAVLLTAGLLPATVLGNLVDRALRLGLTPFVEVTDEAQLDAVRHAEQCVIAVGNKDIRTRERAPADHDRSIRLLPAVLATGTPCPVSASGLDRPEVAAHMLSAGYAAVLVGTGLLSPPHPSAWFDEFTAEVAA